MLRPTLLAVLYLSAAPVLAQQATSDTPANEPGPVAAARDTSAETANESEAGGDEAEETSIEAGDTNAEGASEAEPGTDTADGTSDMTDEADADATEAEIKPADETDRITAQTPRTLIRANVVEDAPIYSLAESYDETFWDSGEPFGPVAAGWTEIGEVEDLVIDNRGQVLGVTVDVGGFLGMGENTVLIALEDMRLVQVPTNDDFFVVTRMTTEQLENAEEVGEMVGRED